MEVLITDLTYMRGGVCIAGINYETLENVRPVLRYGQIQRDFVEENNIYPGAIIGFAIRHKKDTMPPHIEDCIFEDAEFVKFINQSEWHKKLDTSAEESLSSAFRHCITENKGVIPGTETCSLATIKLNSGVKINFFDSDIDAVLPFKTRVSFQSANIQYHLPVTDLQFIDYCIERFESGISRDKLKANIEEVINSSNYLCLRIGLTRPFKKSVDAQELCYLQVNGIYSEKLDLIIRHFMTQHETLSNTESRLEFEDTTGILQFRIFNIPLINNEKELGEMNSFIASVDVKRFSADIVDGRFWSILVGYIRRKMANKVVKQGKLSCETLAELTEDEVALYEILRKWRNKKAEMLDVPEYFVFSNKTLMTIAKVRPCTSEMLLNITGVGEKKVAEYGEEIIGLINL
ncbi:MAG: HRDC domain-containing protein [Nitrospirota bacterium]